jgi:hypothetical protein
MKLLLRIAFAAALVHVAPAFAQAPKRVVASPALQKEFDGFILKCRAARKGNDSAAVAGMTRLPFMNDGSIRDATQFRERIYKRDFTAKNRACIQRGKSVYDRDGENNESFFIFCGQQIFVLVPFHGHRRQRLTRAVPALPSPKNSSGPVAHTPPAASWNGQWHETRCHPTHS